MSQISNLKSIEKKAEKWLKENEPERYTFSIVHLPEIMAAFAQSLDINSDVEKAYQRLWQIRAHGGIGPDSKGNPECKPCTHALKLAISGLAKHIPTDRRRD